MIKILTVIGARPQIIKAAALNRAIQNNFADKIKEVIVHTGQHYDENMSGNFFSELGIPQPDYNLNTGAMNKDEQIAFMTEGIQNLLDKEKPQAIILYGDTNSTLAGTRAAQNLNVPIVHIEAGLRSFNDSMPEEFNRITCDHAAAMLFAPTQTAYNNLLKEGLKENSKVYHCGDVMFDNSIFFSERAEKESEILQEHSLNENNFVLVTIHRHNNTDESERLNVLFSAISKLAKENDLQFVLPLHPRTEKALMQNLSKELYQEVKNNSNLLIIPPVGFREMILLEKKCAMVMTDSGGVQKEAFFFKKPCIILRPETEWVELVECGSAIIADANAKRISEAFSYFRNKKDLLFPQLFGDGKAAEFICSEILKTFKEC